MEAEFIMFGGNRNNEAGLRRMRPDIKPRGTHTAYNYFVQCFRDQQKQAAPEQKVEISEFSRECGEIWRSMSPEEKQPYQDLARQDKERYDEEMQFYSPHIDMPKRKKVKKEKDPNAPKRPLTSYLWFCQDERPLVKDANPDMNGADITKELGHRWRQIDPEVKQKYQEFYEKDKRRYEEAMLVYLAERNGGTLQYSDQS